MAPTVPDVTGLPWSLVLTPTELLAVSVLGLLIHLIGIFWDIVPSDSPKFTLGIASYDQASNYATDIFQWLYFKEVRLS